MLLLCLLVSLVVNPLQVVLVLCNVVFKCGEDREVYAESVDLDYWSIRQWRALYLRFLKFQQDRQEPCTFEVIPILSW